MKYDVIIIGLGAMGSAAAYQSAKLGLKVLAIDQFSPPHALGSTHGDTRITRLAIGEGLEYVPIVKRSHELWREIEQETNEELFVQCGGLVLAVSDSAGYPNSTDFLETTYNAADLYGIRHEKLSNEDLKNRFPQFHLIGDERGYYEPEAGYLKPEKCVAAQIELAKKYGATIKLNEKMISFNQTGDLVTVETTAGSYEASKLVLSMGPWVKTSLPSYEHLFKIHRQVLYWFDIADNESYEQYRTMPIFLWEFGPKRYDNFYGFPAIDGREGGLKLATEVYDEETSPENIAREVTSEETKATFETYVRRQFPHLKSTPVKVATCMYTDTPDANFLIDFHPENPNVIVASPCSGHGFKHSAAIGEIIAQLAYKGKSDIDISSFSFERFLST